MFTIQDLKRILFFIIALMVLASCQSQGSNMPEEMPEDFAFSVSFGIMGENKIDTFEGIIIKDLVTAGTAEADMFFTRDELLLIYEQMVDINMLKTMDLKGKLGCAQIPYGEDEWKIRVNGLEKRIQWTSKNCVETEDSKTLAQLRNFVFEIVKEKEEYQKLPAAIGGYD